jgi:hypothetical protein
LYGCGERYRREYEYERDTARYGIIARAALFAVTPVTVFSSSIVMSETTIPVDYGNRGVAQIFEQTLTPARIGHDVKESEAGHSFLNKLGTWWFKSLRGVDIGYDEAAAEDARSRIVAFFRK